MSGAEGDAGPAVPRVVRAGDHVEVKCYDGEGQDQGHAVYRVLGLYEPGPHGQFARVEFEFCTDQYLQWYEESAGAAGGRLEKRLVHFCSEMVDDCAETAADDVEVTHVDIFSIVDDISATYLHHKRLNPAAKWPAPAVKRASLPLAGAIRPLDIA